MEPDSRGDTQHVQHGEAVCQGYLRKLRSVRKRWFVAIRGGNAGSRLDYWESERKWRAGARPRRSVPLLSCLSIAQRLDTKHPHVLGLYTRDTCLCLLLDSDHQLDLWLTTLTTLHRDLTDPHPHPTGPGAPLTDGDPSAAAAVAPSTPSVRQFVWQVNVQKKGLGATHNIIGLYSLCLTEKKLTFVKVKPNNTDMRVVESVEFTLMSIRRCGDSECFFYMEVGRSTVTGAGELWMHTEDPNIAQSMHQTILRAMSSQTNTIKDELGPKSRSRSSSANDASMPILTRRQTHAGSKSHGLSPSSDSLFCGGRSCVGLCISPCVTASAAYCVPQEADLPPVEDNSNAKNDITDISGNIGGKPPIEDCHVVKVAHERTRSLPLTEDETNIPISNELRSKSGRRVPVNLSSEKVIATAQTDSLHKGAQKPTSQMNWGRRASTGCRIVKWSPSHIRSGSVGSITGVRERCDSLPSRANTAVPVPHPYTPIGLSRFVSSRPHSMFIGHTVGQSPPVIANSPLSPNSGACSTDSAGSSISIDETDNFHHSSMIDEKTSMVGRLLNSLTPDQRTIIEEVADETTGAWSSYLKDTVESNDKYLMATDNVGRDTTDASTPNIKDASSPVPIAGAFCHPGDYMPMSPASVDALKMVHSARNISSANHSRTSSIAEEVLADSSGIATTEDGYVDMEPSTNTNDQTMSPVGSVSSVVSGTPSTDIRLSEYPLEKVYSFFTPSEEAENRQTRAHSLGSRPDHLKKVINRPETIHSSANSGSTLRTRACSLGSRSKYKDNRILNHGTPPHHHMLHLHSAQNSNKSFSVPLLSGVPQVTTPSRHGYNFVHSSAEPEDLMEMDFTKQSRPDEVAEITALVNNLSVHSSPSAAKSNISIAIASNKNTSDGYMDMSPVNVARTNFADMHRSDSVSSGGGSVPKSISNVRKTSIAKSPPVAHPPVQPCTPEGYVEMTWNCAKTNNAPSSISSNPITINFDNKNDTKVSLYLASSSTSPIYSSAMQKSEDENQTKVVAKSPPKTSTASPSNPAVPSPFSSLKRRSKKLQNRRNSKEILTSGTNQSTLTNLTSPVKTLTLCSEAERKSSMDNTETMDENKTSSDLLFCHEDTFSDYMEMNPPRLSTVKEMNESSLTKTDKDMKQIINNATKVCSNINVDLSDYISLNPNATVDQRNLTPNLCTYNYPQNNQLIYSSNAQNVKKSSSPESYKDIDINMDIKDNHEILSSNPLANKSFMSLTCKSNIANIKQVQNVKKPIVVTFTGQTQPSTANFKPIPCNEFWEPRPNKSGSPKPVESVLNRQLTDNKNNRGDGYEILSQNGQFGKNTSRPGSVNKCKKGNGVNSRPPSVTSQGDISTALSRPSSVSSEMNSTPTNSRPASVTGEREAGNHELNYATLALDPSERSPRPPPTPTSNRSEFSYAQIDFVKSEELKNSKNLSTVTKN